MSKKGYQYGGPRKKHQRWILRARFVRSQSIVEPLVQILGSSPASRSLRYGAMEGALARGLLGLSSLQPQYVDRPVTECHKSSASEARNPGRHHLGNARATPSKSAKG